VLQFPTITLLWSFAKELNNKSIHINTWERTLICDCPESEINLALTAFKAKMMEEMVSKANV
jgi:hypothetical protein